MTAPVLYTLRRHRDVSNVSGTGDVATIVEFGSGLTVLHWDSDTPSVQVHTDFRHIERLHGHSGASSIVELNDTGRLVGAYQRTVDLMLRLSSRRHPVTVKPHPDHPDCLRVTFDAAHNWALWVHELAGFPNAVHAAVQEEVNGELEHRWITPDGAIWLVYHSPLPDDEPPLKSFEREDR